MNLKETSGDKNRIVTVVVTLSVTTHCSHIHQVLCESCVLCTDPNMLCTYTYACFTRLQVAVQQLHVGRCTRASSTRRRPLETTCRRRTYRRAQVYDRRVHVCSVHACIHFCTLARVTRIVTVILTICYTGYQDTSCKRPKELRHTVIVCLTV